MSPVKPTAHADRYLLDGAWLPVTRGFTFLNADAAKRARLMRTREGFVSRLGKCSSNECRKATHLKRNNEVVSIMRGDRS